MTTTTPARGAAASRTFWFFWAIDALITLVFVAFFVIGLADGSVSSFNFGLWVLILFALGSILLGSYGLRRAGWNVWAMAVALLMAIPGLLFGLFFLAILIANPRWN